jgi:hypothetical protein
VVEALLRREGMGVSENALLTRARGYLLRGAVLAALTLLMTLLYAGAAWAEIFTVTNLNDSGTGSLREAINDAEARVGADEIVFADGLGGTITLRSTLPTVTDPAGLVIEGGGDVTVSGNDAVRVFLVGRRSFLDEGALTLRNLTIADGSAPPDALGGGIGNFGGTLKVINSTISGNSAGDGGGGIINLGTLVVTDSTISNNSAIGLSGQGGGIWNLGEESMLKVINSNLSQNSATFGGGTLNSAGTVTIMNSTISSNSATVAFVRSGGGISNYANGTMTIMNSTISSNSAGSGGGIYIFSGGNSTLRSTIVANNTSGGNCFGPLNDAGYNVEDANTCGFTQATGSLPNTNPLLDPAGLADNGGPTQTIALLPESPAVDLVSQEACPPPQTDQRGVERPQGEACDAGAFELVQGPQTKADCKKGGWEEFGFKNQGQCIASLQRNAEATQ